MSSSTVQQPEKQNPMVAKMLDRARSLNIRPDPEDTVAAPATKPVMRVATTPAVEAAPAAEVPSRAERDADAAASATTQASVDSKRESRGRRKPDTGRTLNRSFEIVTGPSTRALTVRIPEDIHARLVLVATGNRLGRTGQASTLNELIAEGIEHVLERYDAA